MPSRKNRQPQHRPTPARKFSTLEIGITIFVLGVSLSMGFIIAQNILPEEKTPKATDYEFDLELFKQRKQQLINQAKLEQELLKNDMGVKEAKRHLLDKPDLRLVPERFMDKWIPDPTRFEGIREFLEKTQTNGTIVEEFFYLAPPIFQKAADDKFMIGFATDTQELLNTLQVGGCFYLPNAECHQSEMKLKHGDLYMYEFLNGKKEPMKLTRVYYVPSFELLA